MSCTQASGVTVTAFTTEVRWASIELQVPKHVADVFESTEPGVQSRIGADLTLFCRGLMNAIRDFNAGKCAKSEVEAETAKLREDVAILGPLTGRKFTVVRFTMVEENWEHLARIAGMIGTTVDCLARAGLVTRLRQIREYDRDLSKVAGGGK